MSCKDCTYKCDEWVSVPFRHDGCGAKLTVVDIYCCPNGTIGVFGLCVLCGTEVWMWHSFLRLCSLAEQTRDRIPHRADDEGVMLPKPEEID